VQQNIINDELVRSDTVGKHGGKTGAASKLQMPNTILL
jgi:hypothetical protein